MAIYSCLYDCYLEIWMAAMGLLKSAAQNPARFHSTGFSRPKAGAPHSRLSGAPIQYRKEAVRGDPQGALSCHLTKDRAAIQFSTGHEKAVIQMP